MSKRHDREAAEKLGPFRDGHRVPWFTLDDLLKIYQEVSTNHVHCPAGCHECCKKGTEVSFLEQLLIEFYCAYKGYPVLTKGQIVGNCPYTSPMGLCRIYPVRPFVCRIFGVTDGKEMACLVGQKPVDTPYSYEQMRDRFREITYLHGRALKIPTATELDIAMRLLIIRSGKDNIDGQQETAQCDGVPSQDDQGANEAH